VIFFLAGFFWADFFWADFFWADFFWAMTTLLQPQDDMKQEAFCRRRSPRGNVAFPESTAPPRWAYRGSLIRSTTR
jgi:hypothetical protein